MNCSQSYNIRTHPCLHCYDGAIPSATADINKDQGMHEVIQQSKSISLGG